MGNQLLGVYFNANVKVNANRDSISTPGQKSVVSDPVGKDLYQDFEEFFADVAVNVKAPILPWDRWAVKDHVYTECGPNECDSHYIVDGRMLQLVGRQPSGEDQKAQWCKVSVDYQKKTIVSTNLDLVTEKPLSWSHVHFHMDESTQKFQLESWVEQQDGSRSSGPHWASFVEWVFLRPHLFLRQCEKVRVRALQEEPNGEDFKVCLSQDLSDFFTDAETLLDALVTMFKQDTVSMSGQVVYGDEEDEVTLVTPFFLQNPLAPGGQGGLGAQSFPDVLSSTKLRADRNNKRLFSSSTLQGQDGLIRPFVDTHIQLYENPLRAGYYLKRPQTTNAVASFYEALQLHYYLNRLAAEGEVIRQVDSLDEKNFFF